IDGETAELIDCHALFATHAPTTGAHSLTCRLVGEDAWMRSFLGPIVEAAGYRIVAGDEPADLALLDAAADAEAEVMARKAIRLRGESGGVGDADSIYRYDRAGLMTALLRAGEELAA